MIKIMNKKNTQGRSIGLRVEMENYWGKRPQGQTEEEEERQDVVKEEEENAKNLREKKKERKRIGF